MSDLNLINTLQLKIFVTVAEERTLKAAAVKKVKHLRRSAKTSKH